MRRFHAELEHRFGQRWCDRHHAGRRQNHSCCGEDNQCSRRLGSQRRIDGRMRVVACVAICARHRGRRETTGDVDVIVRLIVRPRYAMGVNVLGRRVGLGLVLVRMAVGQRRGRRGETRRERESKPKQT